jgi:hypothetical protein
MNKEVETIILDPNNVIENFNEGVPYIKLYDNIAKNLRKILTQTEFVTAYSLVDYIDEFNVIKFDEKFLSMQNLSEYLNDTYSSMRRIIPSLINKNVICNYYIEIYDNKYTKAFILNPSIATKENYNSKYKELFENPKLVEINHAMYSNNSDRSTPEYRQWIQDSLDRDNYTCQCCCSTENLEVHHILNYAQYKDLRTNLDNSITLCQCCHSPMIKGSFHNIYGTKNNTKEQLDEYLGQAKK